MSRQGRQEGVINFGWGEWRTQEFCSGGVSTNSVEDRGQREQGSGGGRPPSQGFWRQL